MSLSLRITLSSGRSTCTKHVSSWLKLETDRARSTVAASSEPVAESSAFISARKNIHDAISHLDFFRSSISKADPTMNDTLLSYRGLESKERTSSGGSFADRITQWYSLPIIVAWSS